MTARVPGPVRRHQIAQAALKVLAEQGLGRFTTQAIAAELGVTDGSLFRHFPTKADVVLAALDELEARMFEGFPPVDPDPVLRLERFFRHRAGLLLAEPLIARLAFSEELPHAAGEAGARQVASWKARSLGFVEACLDEAVSMGRLSADLPRHEAALLVVGALLALARLAGPDLSADAVDRVWRLLRSSLGGA
jgi:AcrR family transcriptional regulator